ncbi:hypothetical protein TNCV_3169151 [Trichonephila clavipes]|nr:hypothetical protein TNCV_3169151 [Trichonephila clavipes]
MRVGGWCLESAAEVRWGPVFFPYTLVFGFMTNMVSWETIFSIAVYMEHFYFAFAGIYRTGNFPPIAGRTKDFDVLPSSSYGNFLFLVHGLQTFDVLPSSTGNLPLIVDGLRQTLMCWYIPAGAPNILAVSMHKLFFPGRHTHMIAELFSRDGTIFFLFIAGCNFF